MASASPPSATTATQSSTSSKSKVVTGVLVSVCLLFAIVLAYLLYRLFKARARRSKALSKVGNEVLPTSTRKIGKPSTWGRMKQYLHFNSSSGSRSISFNPSLLVANRPRSQSESTKDLASSQLPTSGQRHSQAILAEDEPETRSAKPAVDGRWAFIMSWRDRAIREAEIPSLPPTSHAPTTIFSGPSLRHPQVHPSQSQRPQQQEAPVTPRTQPRRCFTIMNT